MFFFFFFQAEDGIRDRDVTGVQTCALPISTVEDDLLGMHRLDGIQGDTELAGILHVHHQTIRRYLPDGAELVVPIGNERLVPDFDRLSHDPLSRLHGQLALDGRARLSPRVVCSSVPNRDARATLPSGGSPFRPTPSTRDSSAWRPAHSFETSPRRCPECRPPSPARSW